MGVRGHALCNFTRHRARACIRFSATHEHRDPRHTTQPIEGELSPKRTTHFSASRPQMPSMTNHRRRRPAISKSELLMVPAGFSNEDTSCSRMSSGHRHLNTVGTHSDSLPTMIPHMPWLEASTMPVGSCVDLRSSIRHPFMAVSTCLF